MECIKKYKPKKKLAYRLPGYSPLSIAFRFTVISIFSVLTLFVIVYAVGDINDFTKVSFYYYLVIIIAFNIASEIQILLDNILERFFPVPNKIKIRLTIQFISAIVILGFTHKIVMGTFDPASLGPETRPGVYMGIIIGLFIVFLMAQALVIVRITEKWTASQKLISELKREKLEMDYHSLQDQLNPHFLFNNLSVLKSLIIYDKEAAVTFTENFTDVYRYVLKSKDKKFIKLKDEINFIQSYIGLHKERLGDGLIVKFILDKDSEEKRIPPLTLQLLIENAIKHNIASTDTPLFIEVKASKDILVVKNNYQPRETSYSTKTGLNNLIKRYDLLTKNKIKIFSNSETFTIEIPLIVSL